MADHKHGEMDITVQENPDSFIWFVLRGTGTVTDLPRARRYA
jgi:hypothetical protein